MQILRRLKMVEGEMIFFLPMHHLELQPMRQFNYGPLLGD